MEVTQSASSEAQGTVLRRIAAIAIDMFFLTLIGKLLAAVLGAQLMFLGQSARFIGLGVALLYFGLLNSGLARGQTLGKRLVGLQVVRVGGGFVPWYQSIGRSNFYVVPYVLNGWLTTEALSGLETLIVGIVIVGSITSVISLPVFAFGNRHSGRMLHDVVAGTWVGRLQAPVITDAPRERKLSIATGVMLGVVAMAALLLQVMQSSQPLEKGDPRDFYQALRATRVGWEYGFENSTILGEQKLNVMKIRVRPDRQLTEDEVKSEIQATARFTLEHYQPVSELDLLSVAVVQGYDMGIASQYFSKGERYAVGEWRTRLGLSGDPAQGSGKQVPVNS